jgi:hypothetical protein
MGARIRGGVCEAWCSGRGQVESSLVVVDVVAAIVTTESRRAEAAKAPIQR